MKLLLVKHGETHTWILDSRAIDTLKMCAFMSMLSFRQI